MNTDIQTQTVREIKFRIWDKSKNKMRSCMALSWEHFGKGNVLNSIASGDVINSDYVIKIADAVVMQYTGKKDKNKKEIYSGDILKFIDNGEEYISVVKWCDNGCCFETNNFLPSEWNYAQIIGNIYENSELIN